MACGGLFLQKISNKKNHFVLITFSFFMLLLLHRMLYKLRHGDKLKNSFLLRFFMKIIRHIKFKVTDFATSNNSIIANKRPLTNLERFLRLHENQP